MGINLSREVVAIGLTVIFFPLIFTLHFYEQGIDTPYLQIVVLLYCNLFFSRYATVLIKENELRRSLVIFDVSKRQRNGFFLITYLLSLDALAPFTIVFISLWYQQFEMAFLAILIHLNIAAIQVIFWSFFRFEKKNRWMFNVFQLIPMLILGASLSEEANIAMTEINEYIHKNSYRIMIANLLFFGWFYYTKLLEKSRTF